ncbi:MAG: DUF5696 domain-containing protein [Oscillospiraceae bacterium]|nr:DUF5696 domain-containing protein [Oscillospiraceae bacterium]
MKLLQDFGSSSNTENGYIFVPDGSGALISFDKPKKNTSPFLSQVYGFDKSLEVKKRPELVYNSMLPVFGMKDNDDAFLAIIEDGEAFASIGANASGMLSERAEVFPVFQTLSNQNTSIGAMEGQSKFISVQEKMYQGNIRVRYAFLQKDSSNYVEMAKYYRNYLIKTEGIEKLEKKDNLPMNLELIGSINKVQSTLGIKYNGIEPLTTFSQAEDILNNLMENGVSNINIKYSGWFTGGIEQEYAGKFGVEKSLGGVNGLKALNKFAEKNNLSLFPAINYLTTPSKSSGYSRLSMAVKQLDQNTAKYYKYDSVSLIGSSYREILSPTSLKKATNKFIDAYIKTDIKSLCINDFGTEVFADYTKSNVFDRQSAINLYRSLLLNTKDKVGSVMIGGSYGFAANAADIILNAPTTSSGYQVTDKSVPFYAIVYHGYKDYSAAPLNESASINDEVLNYIEQGALPYFKIMNADGSATKNTEYNYLCSNSFSIWKDQISSIYKSMEEVLSPVRTQTISSYDILSDDVSKITYENGYYIIVNYSDKDFTYDNTTVESKGYKLVEGESK